MSNQILIKVCVLNGGGNYIHWVNGQITTGALCDIEDQLNDSEAELDDGEYLLACNYEPDQRGEYGVIEIPGYWNIEVKEYEHHPDDYYDAPKMKGLGLAKEVF